MDLTRRDFIKVSGVFFCNGLFPIPGEAVSLSCPACNTLNLSSIRCFGCGRGLIEGIGCSSCVEKYSCLQIPFPNHKYLIDTDKPLLKMEVVKF